MNTLEIFVNMNNIIELIYLQIGIIFMKGNCGQKEKESICDLNISKYIRYKSIRKLLANDS